MLFGLGLGSRRAVDQDLRDSECAVLDNINRLAGTDQKSLPVSKTLDHFLGHVGYEPFARLRYLCMHRLLRMKALDDFRFQGDFVVAVDGTGLMSFSHRHCPHCLTQKHATGTVYLHPVLEAKLLSSSKILPVPPLRTTRKSNRTVNSRRSTVWPPPSKRPFRNCACA